MRKILMSCLALSVALGFGGVAQGQVILINIDCFPEGEDCPFMISPDPVFVDVGCTVQWVVGSTCNQPPCPEVHPDGFTVNVPGMGYDSGPLMPGEVSPPLVIPSLPPGTYPYTVTGSNVNGALIIPDPCPWDLDGDGAVLVGDLLELLGDFGPCEDPENCPADFDGDGFVGIRDLLVLLRNWGPCP